MYLALGVIIGLSGMVLIAISGNKRCPKTELRIRAAFWWAGCALIAAGAFVAAFESKPSA